MFTTIVLDTQIDNGNPVFTDWFFNCHYLALQSSDVGEYTATGYFIEVNVALFAQISPGPIGVVERLVKRWQKTINTIDLIELPQKINECFPMRLRINPSVGFHARLLAISC